MLNTLRKPEELFVYSGFIKMEGLLYSVFYRMEQVLHPLSQ